MEYLDEVQLYTLNNLRAQGEQAIKNYLVQYSPEVLTNSLIRAIRISDPLSVNDYKNLLLADNLELNRPGLGGDTPIYAATLKNNLWMVNDLLSKDADINALCVNGSYPVLAACSSPDKLELLHFLLSSGANPNLVTNAGDTSFTYCVKGTSPQSITRMIEAGADVNFRDGNNYTPIQSAMLSDKPDNLIALCQGAKDKIQLDEFRRQVDEIVDNGHLVHSILNSIETKMNLDKDLQPSKKTKPPKI